MTLSLCMIVKDEEKNLPGCIGSVQGLVNEVIMVDTGSRDRTEEVAERMGARVFRYPWNDSFADARNFALSKASGDWILIMDADDELEWEDREKLAELLSGTEEGINVYCARTLCYSGESPDIAGVLINMNIRLIRNGKGYRYRGRIHEQLVLLPEDEEKPQAVVATAIRFHHYGYLDSYIREKDKHGRNIRLIRMELEERPEDPFMLFNLGNEYYALGQPEQALACYRSCLDRCDGCSLHSALLLRAALCCEALRDEKGVLWYAALGLRSHPELTDFEFLRAGAFLRQKRLEEAIRSYKKCIRMGPPPVSAHSIAGVATFRSHFALSGIYLRLGSYEKARRHCEKALRSNPTYRAACSELLDLLLREGRTPSAVRDRLRKMLPRRADCRLILSDLFYDRGLFGEALLLAREAGRLSPGNPAARYREGVCCLCLNRPRRAAPLLEQAAACSEAQGRAGFLREVCAVLNGEPERTSDPWKMAAEPSYQAAAKLLRAGLEGKEPPRSREENGAEPKPLTELLTLLLRMGREEEFRRMLPFLEQAAGEDDSRLLGEIYFHCGRFEDAFRELLRFVRKSDRVDGATLELLREAQARSGRP